MNARTFITTTIAVAAMTLTACAGSSTTTAGGTGSTPGVSSGMPMGSSSGPAAAGSPASGIHNSADAAFATQMIPHHEQAVQMADMAVNAAGNAEVKTLAIDIKKAQDPEISRMSGWLTGWGKPIPTASMGGMAGMDHGTGMMSDADMAKLGQARGAPFDRLWVQMMIIHHHGAVTMAKTELASGQNPDAKTLAQSISTSQTAQIGQLQRLLLTLPA